MLFGLFLISLSVPTTAFAQNSISGKLINAPGDATQDIPQRTITVDRNFLFPQQVVSNNVNTNASETYSFSYSGGPFFQFNEMDVYVNPGLNADPQWDSQCILNSDITLLQNYVEGGGTLTKVQLIAADVNIDGVVNQFDADMLNAVVLGQDQQGTPVNGFNNSVSVGGNTYFDRTIVYPTTAEVNSLNTGSNFNLTYTYSYSDPNIPSGSNSGRSFYSIRLGDLNGSCSTYNGFQDEEGGGESFKNSLVGQNSKASGQIILAPNPTNHSLLVQADKAITRVSVLNLSGKLLSSHDNPNGGKYFLIAPEYISNIPPGIYLTSVSLSDNTNLFRKFIKK